MTGTAAGVQRPRAPSGETHPGLEGSEKEFVMQLGMIGLGRMGANMVRRLLRNGHACVVYDRNPGAVAELASEGAQGAASLKELVGKLSKPRASG